MLFQVKNLSEMRQFLPYSLVFILQLEPGAYINSV